MKKSIIALLLILNLFQFGVFAQNQEGQGVERYALYIASNLGGEDRATLRYAGSDAEKLSATMIELGGVKKQNSFVLIDSTKAEIDGAFNNIAAIINNSKTDAKRVEFLFYYSGHSDENALLLGEEAYDYSELKAKISSIPSDVHVVVLDSCFSGNFIRAKGGSRQKSFLVDDSSVVKGHAYLSSSSETESSQESDDIEASYFTQALITGLRGAADTSGDNRVSLNELYYYAFNETLKQTETSAIGTQHPSFDITLVGSGDLVLTDISTAEAVLVLPPESHGRFLVRNIEGKLAAEINKAEGTVTSLALPTGFYTVTLIGDKATAQAQVKLAKNDIYTVKTDSLSQIALSQGVARGSSEGETTNRPSSTNTELEEKLPGTSPNYLTDEEIDAILYGKTENKDSQNTEEAQNNNQGADSEDSRKKLTDEEIDALLSNTSKKDVSFNCTNWKTNFYFGLLPGIGFPSNSKDVRIALSPLVSSQHCIQGFQVNGLVGIIENNLQGVQVSGLVNISKGNVQGIQIAGLTNISTGNLTGVQYAGLVNISKGTTKGVQVAGLVNIADEITGVQVGLINLAQKNTGVSVGLINIIKDGIFDPAFYWANDEFFIQYQGGTNFFYTTFLAGVNKNFNFDYGVLGMGIGTRIGKDFLGLDLELLNYQVLDENLGSDLATLKETDSDSSLDEIGTVFNSYSYPSFRATLNFRFNKNFGVFLSFNSDFETVGKNQQAFENRPSTNTKSFNLGDKEIIAHTYFSFGLKF